MKKNNWIIALLALVAAVGLVILYLALGFLHVDHGLDIVLAIIWILIIAILGYVIHRRERVRMSAIRRIYINGDKLYNSELGIIDINQAMPTKGVDEFADFVAKSLMTLEYGFDIVEMPEDFNTNYLVESTTFKFKKAQEDADDPAQRKDRITEWEGELLKAVKDEQDSERRYESLGQFSNAEGLQELLSANQVF